MEFKAFPTSRSTTAPEGLSSKVRLPKRGFTPPFRVENQIIGLEDLTRVPAGTEITQESLATAGLIDAGKGPAKLLANGEISQAVTVRGIKVSASAKEKIVAAGGKVEE